VQKIFKLNPFLYIVDGFRDSLFYGVNFWEHYLRIPFFIVTALVLFVIGSALQSKYSKFYYDWI
jgi:ABC-type polysaccharide/polyol phosphate export permease